MEGTSGSIQSFNNGGSSTHLAGLGYSVCVRREKGYCAICWSADIFQLSLQSDDGGESGNRGMSEHDKDQMCKYDFWDRIYNIIVLKKVWDKLPSNY